MGITKLLAAFLSAGLIVVIGCSTASDDQNYSQTAPDTVTASGNVPALQDILDERKARFAKSAPPEMVKTFSEGIQEIAESPVMATALTVGDTAPDFRLPNAVGDTVHLSMLLQDGPVILAWYRGGW